MLFICKGNELTNVDAVDEAILRCLKGNSRISLRQMAALVHLTPPAVAERVRRLEERGIILRYTIAVNRSKLGTKLTAWINVFMKNTDHARFLRFTEVTEEVRECHRLSGDSCYLLKVETSDQVSLERFLDGLLVYGNYRLNIALSSTIKD